jgi:hypothetical protein
MIAWLINNKLGRTGKDLVVAQVKVPSHICLEGLRKTTENLSQDSRSSKRDSTPGPTEYEVAVPTARLLRSVQHFEGTYCLHLQPWRPTSISSTPWELLVFWVVTPWRWRQYVPPKCRYLPTIPHGVTTQNTKIDDLVGIQLCAITRCKADGDEARLVCNSITVCSLRRVQLRWTRRSGGKRMTGFMKTLIV